MLTDNSQPHTSLLNQILMGGLVICWLVAMLFAFWWFLVRDIRPFYGQQEQFARFDSASLVAPLRDYIRSSRISTDAPATATVFHFWNPECLCSRFTREHVRTLIEQFGTREVQFVVVLSPDTEKQEDLWKQGQKLFPSAKLVAASELADNLPIPASPATAILDTNNKLAYFGPYSLSGLCLSNEDGFVETTLTSLLSGEIPPFNTISGSGCFCRWR